MADATSLTPPGPGLTTTRLILLHLLNKALLQNKSHMRNSNLIVGKHSNSYHVIGRLLLASYAYHSSTDVSKHEHCLK